MIGDVFDFDLCVECQGGDIGCDVGWLVFVYGGGISGVYGLIIGYICQINGICCQIFKFGIGQGQGLLDIGNGLCGFWFGIIVDQCGIVW